MYSGTRAGGVRRLRFVNPKQGPIWNKYIVGSGVGAVSRANRAAYRKRASNNAQQKPCGPRCCNYGCSGCNIAILYRLYDPFAPDLPWIPVPIAQFPVMEKYFYCTDDRDYRSMLEWDRVNHPAEFAALVTSNPQIAQLLSNPMATDGDFCREVAKGWAIALAGPFQDYKPADQKNMYRVATTYPTGQPSCGHTVFTYTALAPVDTL